MKIKLDYDYFYRRATALECESLPPKLSLKEEMLLDYLNGNTVENVRKKYGCSQLDCRFTLVETAEKMLKEILSEEEMRKTLICYVPDIRPFKDILLKELIKQNEPFNPTNL